MFEEKLRGQWFSPWVMIDLFLICPDWFSTWTLPFLDYFQFKVTPLEGKIERSNPVNLKSVIMANSEHLFKHVTIERVFGPSKYQNVQYRTNSNLSDSCNSYFSSPYNEKICVNFNHKNKRYNTRVKKPRHLQ